MPTWLLWVLFSFLREGSFCVVLAGLELTEILLPLPCKYQNCERVLTHRAYTGLLTITGFQQV